MIAGWLAQVQRWFGIDPLVLLGCGVLVLAVWVMTTKPGRIK